MPYPLLRPAALLLLAALGAGLAGCAKRGARGPKDASDDKGARPTKVVHEPCKLEAAQEKLDVNGDGRPEVSIVMQGGRAVCQAADLNQDGSVDVYAYFDEAGEIRRREYAYSRDDSINEIRIYRSGTLAEVHQSTVTSGRLDTWHLYEGGRRSRTERDSDGDGIIDEWWEYPDPERPGCPMMYSDSDGDANPDPGSEVDLCDTGYIPPKRDEYEYESPDFQRPGSTPTEVENRVDDTGGGDAEGAESGGGADEP